MNFNNPLELTQISRDTPSEDFPNGEEYAFRVWIRWEDIMLIEEADSSGWEKYKGPKYIIVVDGEHIGRVIFGNVSDMVNHWAQFRNTIKL